MVLSTQEGPSFQGRKLGGFHVFFFHCARMRRRLETCAGLGFSFGQSRVLTWHSGMWGEFAIER